MTADGIAETAAAAGVAPEVVERWTLADWQRHVEMMDRRLAAFTAAADRDEAACAEASRCGCPIAAEYREDGSPVIGTAEVVHGCGRRC